MVSGYLRPQKIFGVDTGIIDSDWQKFSPPKQKIEKQKVQKIKDEETQHAKPEWEPKNWRPLWDAIQTVRDTIKAPVDEPGCEELSRNYDRFPEKEKVYHNLVGLMLSS